MSYSNSQIEYPTLDTFNDQNYSNMNSILNYSPNRINDNIQQPLTEIPSIQQQLNQMQYSPQPGSQTLYSPGIQTPPSQIVPPQIQPNQQIYTNFPQVTQPRPVSEQNTQMPLQNQTNDNLNPENQRLIQILNTAVNVANEQEDNGNLPSTSNYKNVGNKQKNNKPSTSNYKNNLKTLSKTNNNQTNKRRRSSRSRKSIKPVDKKINRSSNKEKKCSNRTSTKSVRRTSTKSVPRTSIQRKRGSTGKKQTKNNGRKSSNKGRKSHTTKKSRTSAQSSKHKQNKTKTQNTNTKRRGRPRGSLSQPRINTMILTHPENKTALAKINCKYNIKDKEVMRAVQNLVKKYTTNELENALLNIDASRTTLMSTKSKK